jgi:hypothetical protein
MRTIYEKGLANRILGPGLVYLFCSSFFIILILLVMIGEPFPISPKIFSLGLFLLVPSIILLFISLLMIFTTKPFKIFDQGIQYVTIQLIPQWNYKDNFIPYSKIRSFILFDHPIGETIQIKDVKGNIYDIPLECTSKKVDKEKWTRIAPIDEMIKIWGGGREVNVDTRNTMRGERSIFELDIGTGKKHQGKKRKNIPIIFKFLSIFGIVITIILSSMFYITLNDIEAPYLFKYSMIFILPFVMTSISLVTSYFFMKKDWRFSHLYK